MVIKRSAGFVYGGQQDDSPSLKPKAPLARGRLALTLKTTQLLEQIMIKSFTDFVDCKMLRSCAQYGLTEQCDYPKHHTRFPGCPASVARFLRGQLTRLPCITLHQAENASPKAINTIAKDT
jgi:hypothetical protein